MKTVDMQNKIVITSNSPAWTDMVAKKPMLAADQMNSGTVNPQPATPSNLGQTVDPHMMSTHINPVR